MKKPFTVMILSLFCISFLSLASADNKAKARVSAATDQPKAIPLTEEEIREALQAAGPVQSLQGELQQRWLDILQAPLEKAVEVVAKAQLTYQRLQTAQSQFDRVRERTGLKHRCPDCDFSADFKTMMPPKASQAGR